MEKPISIVRLPPGFRFHPTDEELVMQYLKRKVFSCPLPAAIIQDFDLGNHDPWDLPGGCEEERYFFSLREAKFPNRSRSNRATISGYWKATGKAKQIVASRSNQVIGLKQAMVFYRGKASSGSRTDYVMHEYRLASSENRANVFFQRKNSIQSLIAPSGEWALFRIFKKKRDTKMDSENEEVSNRSRNDNIMSYQQHSHQDPNSSSSTESSCVTDVSDDSDNAEETSPSSINPEA